MPLKEALVSSSTVMNLLSSGTPALLILSQLANLWRLFCRLPRCGAFALVFVFAVVVLPLSGRRNSRSMIPTLQGRRLLD